MSLHRYQPITKPLSSLVLSGMFACAVHSLTNPEFRRDLWVFLACGQEGTY